MQPHDKPSNPSAQHTRFQDPARWVGHLRNIALDTQRIAAGVLHSIDCKPQSHHFAFIRADDSLQAGLGRNYEIRIYVGYVVVTVSYMVIILNLFLGCHPFHRNWQINPDPGSTWAF